MNKIIGIKTNSGIFNDKPYKNYTFYYQVLNTKDVIGAQVEHVKIKPEIYEKLVAAKKVVNYEFENVLYDSYRNVVDFQ